MAGINHSILSIVLGASIYENAPDLSHPAFRRAADYFLSYLMNEDGLSIPKEDILWLFDTSYSPNSVDDEIDKFLRAERTNTATDLIIYYVGHGAIIYDQYFLTIRTSKSRNHGVSSLSFRWLSKTIYESANNLRILWIIDACYSAEGKRYFLDDDSLVEKQVVGLYTKSGVSLICSSPATRRSVVEKDGYLPLYTSALLRRLEEGIPEVSNDKFSARDLHQQIRTDILQGFDDDAPIPEIHSPVQGEGLEVASFAIFPNHKGLDFAKRTKYKIAKVEEWADNEIKKLEIQYVIQEEHKRKRRLELDEQAKRAIIQINYERQRKGKEEVEQAEFEAKEQLKAAQKRLVGWSESEINETCKAIEDKAANTEDIKNWLKWHSDRMRNFMIQSKQLRHDLQKKSEGIQEPNSIFINNMNDYRRNGQHAIADQLQNMISDVKRTRREIFKSIDTLIEYELKVDKNLKYYTCISENLQMLTTIIAGIKKTKIYSFEFWINRSFADKYGNLILPEQKKKIKFLFRSKINKPLPLNIDYLDRLLFSYQEFERRSVFRF